MKAGLSRSTQWDSERRDINHPVALGTYSHCSKRKRMILDRFLSPIGFLVNRALGIVVFVTGVRRIRVARGESF
ncbi:MAG TPA: hypothetical protein DDZ51_01305 [Planctomycetaceae bacterium]|nr:hypothetical protein [Planctomycetaceae bacterium]